MPLEWSEVEATVRDYARELRKLVAVDEVWVYGSYANGTPRDESDIDIAVISPDMGRNRWEDSKTLAAALPSDVFLLEPIAFHRSLKHRPRGTLLEEILRTGRRVA